MWIAKVPLRISLFSGGDMKAFYEKAPGFCFSSTIDKFVYVSINPNPHGIYRTMYDTVDNAYHPNDIKNVIIKEALKFYGYEDFPLVISSISDIPYHGSGLVSSSAFTVGLVAILRQYFPFGVKSFRKEDLAKEACKIEIELCNHPIGKQDQYAGAYGGLNLFKFCADQSVEIKQDSRWIKNLQSLRDRLLLVYTGISRKANDILKEQEKNLLDEEKFAALKRNGFRAGMAAKFLAEGKLDQIGEMLDDAWHDKKKLANEISNPYIDEIYEKAKKAGALGGKLIGAGGGGFMLLYYPKSYMESDIISSLPEKCEVFDFDFYDKGCEVFKI